MQEENRTTEETAALEEYPEEWLRMTAREGESRKPAIFYYVDPSRLFTDSELMLPKIRDVLRVFEENREEVTLLWHQDPHIRRILPAHRPEVWDQYQALVREFAAAGFGILDDTGEDDEAYFEEIRKNYPGPGPTPGERRAITFCKAFYGDGGFLANCFRNEGKPVMLEAPEILAHAAEE